MGNETNESQVNVASEENQVNFGRFNYLNYFQRPGSRIVIFLFVSK